MLLRVIFLCFIIGLASKKKYIEGICFEVLDGDTIILNDHRIRLFGVDSPELSQKNFDGKAIGKRAKIFLEQIILNKKIKVKIIGEDIYHRSLGIIYLDEVDINKELLLQGYAVVYGNHLSNGYLLAQKDAWLNKRGIFASSGFYNPRFYRLNNKN